MGQICFSLIRLLPQADFLLPYEWPAEMQGNMV